MKHTSIRLSDRHVALIESTGETSTEVVRKALDIYFQLDSEREDIREEFRALISEGISEHEKAHHSKYKGQRLEPPKASADRTVREDVREIREKQALETSNIVPKDMPKNVRNMLKAIKSFHDEGKEPLVAEVGEKVGVSGQSVGSTLRHYGIKSKHAQRNGKKGRYYTFELKERIEELIERGELEE